MKTYYAKQEDVARDWYLVDAQDKVLGRLASGIAHRLRGKHKAIYAPYMDAGDFLIVINAEKISLTGKKLTDKVYSTFRVSRWAQGHDGGEVLKEKPEELLRTAVKGMLREYVGKGHAEETEDLLRKATIRTRHNATCS
jgi:large subunit ribosomal protein L13